MKYYGIDPANDSNFFIFMFQIFFYSPFSASRENEWAEYLSFVNTETRDSVNEFHE